MRDEKKMVCQIDLKTLNQALQKELIKKSMQEKTTTPELPKKNMNPKKDGIGK
jgi:hypothetical protein